MASFGATDLTTRRLSKISSILNSDNTSQFETLISDLLSPANYQRSEAATLFNLGEKHHPNALVLKLCHLLPVSSKRAMYAVLLRDILTVDSMSGEDGIYTHLSAKTQSALYKTLIECVENETDKSVRKKVCDTVSELAAIVLPGYGWHSFLGYMFKWVTSDIDRHRESALLIFAQLVQYSGGLLVVPHLVRLHQAFLECLGSGMVAVVRIAAFTASINFIRFLEKASDRDKFHDLIPLMMQTLNEQLVWNESTARESMFNLLIELAGSTRTYRIPWNDESRVYGKGDLSYLLRSTPQFGVVYRGMDRVVEAMLQTAEAENLEEGTKHLALEFVVTLFEERLGARGKIRKLPQLVIKRLFEVLMKMLSDVEDNPDWHRAEIEHEDAGETNNYIVGQEYLDRLSISLSGYTIVPVIFFEIFHAYLAAPEWQKHHAAFIALAQIAEGCSEVMTRNQLEQVVSVILNSIQDPHPRVRSAAINAFGPLITDLDSYLFDIACICISYHTQTTLASFDATDPTLHQLSQVSAIRNSDNTSQFETLISDLMSPANDQRSEAEMLFNLGKQHHPNALVRKLCCLMLPVFNLGKQHHPNALVRKLCCLMLPVSSQRYRAMCAVLLRVILNDGIYIHLSGNTQTALKITLIMCVENETNKSVLKKVCDTISILAAIVLPDNDWRIFFVFMFNRWVSSDIDRHRESALLIFAQSVQYIGGLWVPHLVRLHQAFLECLDSGMVADVRIAAFTASINFIRYLEKASDRERFHDLIPLMMQTLTEALDWNESTARESMLKLLIELAGTETFVYEGIDEVVEVMFQIADAENLDEGTRRLAHEFVIEVV